jgi:hypothetical protein
MFDEMQDFIKRATSNQGILFSDFILYKLFY